MEDRILADNRSTRPTQQNENGAMPLKPDGTPYTIEEIRQIQAYRKAMAAKRAHAAQGGSGSSANPQATRNPQAARPPQNPHIAPDSQSTRP